MKSVFKRTLAMALSLILVLGTCFVSGVVSAPVASAAEGTSKVQSYADLVAKYGQNGDGFVYTGLEFYEADGKLTDYYVKSGDELTARVYIKSNLWVGESYILTLYDNKFFDIKLAGGPGSTTIATGYTSNYQQAPINPEHPIVIANGSGHTLTTINIKNVGWIKNLCGFSATYLAETDLAQSNTATDITVSTEAYDMTQDIWLFEYYVKIQPGLADGTKGIVTSPTTLWHASMNGTKHDARKKAYIAAVRPVDYEAGKTKLTNTTTMALCMDQGVIDHFVQNHEHEFIIGEAPTLGTVSFKYDDGTNYIDPIQYESGAVINAPEAPSKEGFEFLGWALEGTTDILTFPQTMGNTDVTYVAQFKAIPKYTATFVADGKVVSEAQYKEGEAIVVPVAPEKEGFTFTGWDPVPGTMGTADITFTAQYKEKSAVYFMDGETQINVVKGNAGETVAEPEALSKEGHTFNGWVYADGAAVTFPVTITEETTYIYADWTVDKYEVSFDNDGEITTGEFDFGSVIEFPEPADKTGHTFIGWFDANGNEFKEGATVPVGGLKLTAKFEKNTYNAIFDADIGAWADGEKTKTVPTVYGEQIVAPADPVKEGYKFLGWDSEVGVMGDADKTFVAVWEIQSYEVTWNFDNGEEAQVDEVLYSVSILAPADPVKEGYTFAGWSPEIPELMPANALEFTAIWTVNEYTVTWNNDGETTETIVKYGAEFSGEELTAIGRNFLGWALEGSTEIVEFPLTMGTSDITLNAVWEDIWYTVTWDVDGEKTEAEYLYNDEIAAPADPVKEGFTFVGWTPEVPDTMPAENVEFVAVFEVNSYDVTWNFDNGEDAKVDSVEYGAEIVAPVVPVKVGHTFTGWSPEVPETMPANALSFVATWDKNDYNAIFDANGGQFADGSDKAIVPTEFESAVVAPEAPVKEGFTFVAWTPELSDSMPTEELTYTAIWAEGEGLVYTVDTYTMDVNGEYGEPEVAYYATEENPVTIAPEAPEGFAVAENSILSAPINVDGSTVLKVYFERNTYTFTFDANGGNFNGEETVTVEALYGAEVAAPEAPVMDEYKFVGWDAEVPATMPAENLTFKANWELAHTHTTVLVTEEATCTEDGKEYNKCTGCDEIIGEVVIIPALGHVEGEWKIVTEATYEADGTAVKKCTVCDEIIDTAVISKLLVPGIEITDEDGNEVPADSEIRYGESITLSVTDADLPEGTFVKWFVEGEGAEYAVSEDGLSITLTSVESGDVKVKAIVVNADGEAVLDEFGCENASEIVVKSDACFFWKVVYFFKNLFNFSCFKNIFGFIF